MLHGIEFKTNFRNSWKKYFLALTNVFPNQQNEELLVTKKCVQRNISLHAENNHLPVWNPEYFRDLKYLLPLSGLWDALAMLSMSNVLFFLPNAHIPQGGAYIMYTDTVTVSWHWPAPPQSASRLLLWTISPLPLVNPTALWDIWTVREGAEKGKGREGERRWWL